jgi:hypothetical protein
MHYNDDENNHLMVEGGDEPLPRNGWWSVLGGG